MAINYSGSGGLFPRLRAIFTLLDAVETMQDTTLKTGGDGLLAAYSSAIGDTNTYTVLQSAITAIQQERIDNGLKSRLKSLAQAEVISQINAHKPSAAKSITTALDELILQMRVDAQTVKRNVVTVTPTNPSTSGTQLFSVAANAAGYNNEMVIPETITGKEGTTADSLLLESGAAVQDMLRHDFPAGSGIRGTVGATGNLLSNSGFDTLDSIENDYPTGWFIDIGNVDTTIAISESINQTVTIAGTPTVGFYTLELIDFLGDKHRTVPLAFNADASSVQSAIQSLPGFGSTTVSSTGTNPNFVHTVTFTGCTGAVKVNSYVSELDTGTITLGAPSATVAQSVTGFALVLTGNGSELTTLRQPVNRLASETAYGFSLRARKNAGATGVLRIALIDGAGNVINDHAGNPNSTTLDVSTLSTTDFNPVMAIFRLPKVVPSTISLQLKMTTALGNTQVIFIDDVILKKATPLYNRGPLVVAFSGLTSNPAAIYSLAVANDLAGRIQTWFWRLFGVQLPSATSGSQTISET